MTPEIINRLCCRVAVVSTLLVRDASRGFDQLSTHRLTINNFPAEIRYYTGASECCGQLRSGLETLVRGVSSAQCRLRSGRDLSGFSSRSGIWGSCRSERDKWMTFTSNHHYCVTVSSEHKKPNCVTAVSLRPKCELLSLWPVIPFTLLRRQSSRFLRGFVTTLRIVTYPKCT